MDKKIIRKEMLAQLKFLSSSQREKSSQTMTDLLVETEAYKSAASLATYLSMPHEWNTRYLIEQAQADGKQIFIPKTYSQGRMDFVEYNPNDLVKSAFGVWEPGTYSQPVDKSVINLIHVPGLAWNKAGFRIGYGGGFYDRYLADFHGQTVSTLADFQLLAIEPEIFDQAVKELVIVETDV
ncbi:TPA: 5-formyltetrahydrofolate cyclo-ligase [Streptococcus suis]|nr:5-formyltetrahydrofolate cyclo-ligase [Streptococcus suis]